MKKNLMQRVSFGFIIFSLFLLTLAFNASAAATPSWMPVLTRQAEAAPTEPQPIETTTTPVSVKQAPVQTAQTEEAATAPEAAPQANIAEKTAVMQEELTALQVKVDNLEKTVAAQAELIKQQSMAIDKLVQSVPEAKVAFAPPEPKTLVKKFVLNGVNLFGPKDLEFILSKYRDRELTMTDLKKAADELTTYYRRKGYVSSGAVVPPQEIVDNTVEFKITEGKVGDITIEKPKYSKKRMVENRFMVEKGEVLNSKKIETNLKRINRQPDRVMRAVLSPGKIPETSDILLKVEKEDNPMHFYTELNNRGTRYTKKDRYGLSFVNNNLFGIDDMLTIKGISGFSGDVYSFSGDYNAPISRWDTRIGGYAAYAKADIGGQFAILSPEGRARMWGLYVTQPWFDKEFIDENSSDSLTISSNLNAGFDSISVRNKLLGQETSHDELRILKAGINFDEKDSLGRSVMAFDGSIGIPDFLGSMEKHDVSASRLDAGGEFKKINASLTRLTRLPFSSLYMLNFRVQHTRDALVNSAQMSIGGADTVRGFRENDYLADYGWIMNNELRTPAFLIPPLLRVPFDSKHTRLIDAMQFVAFIDVAKGRLRKPRVGETVERYLVGAGFGLRFDFYEKLHGRIDFGFPTGPTDPPTDGANKQVYFGLKYDW